MAKPPRSDERENEAILANARGCLRTEWGGPAREGLHQRPAARRVIGQQPPKAVESVGEPPQAPRESLVAAAQDHKGKPFGAAAQDHKGTPALASPWEPGPTRGMPGVKGRGPHAAGTGPSRLCGEGPLGAPGDGGALWAPSDGSRMGGSSGTASATPAAEVATSRVGPCT